MAIGGSRMGYGAAGPNTSKAKYKKPRKGKTVSVVRRKKRKK